MPEELLDADLLRVNLRAKDSYILQLKADIVFERAVHESFVRRIQQVFAPYHDESGAIARVIERIDAETRERSL